MAGESRRYRAADRQSGTYLRVPADSERRPRVLVVEDSPEMARAVSRLLVKQNAEPTVCGTVQQAMAAMAHAGPWDGWLFDVMLPDGSGVDLLAKMRADGAHTPCTIMTGCHGAEIMNRCAALNALYCPKPVEPEDIASVLRWIQLADPAFCPDARVDRFIIAYGLTLREGGILRLAVCGEGEKQIAAQLDISVSTVRTRTRTILRKTGFRSLRAVCQAVRGQG